MMLMILCAHTMTERRFSRTVFKISEKFVFFRQLSSTPQSKWLVNSKQWIIWYFFKLLRHLIHVNVVQNAQKYTTRLLFISWNNRIYQLIVNFHRSGMSLESFNVFMKYKVNLWKMYQNQEMNWDLSSMRVRGTTYRGYCPCTAHLYKGHRT